VLFILETKQFCSQWELRSCGYRANSATIIEEGVVCCSLITY